MNESIINNFKKRNRDWERRGLKRRLEEPKGLDFASNDYLGMSTNPAVLKACHYAIDDYGTSACGARSLRGHSKLHKQVETFAARFAGTEASLLLPSGWQANAAILSTLPTANDILICDQYIHASLIDGARLSKAQVEIFSHNNLLDLEEKLKGSTGFQQKFIVIEDVYSMDGDRAPTERILELCDSYDAYVILDLAHSAGIYDIKQDSTARILTRTITGGKALGASGGLICTSSACAELFINQGRPFVFTTAVDPITCTALLKSMQLIEESPDIKTRLHNNTSYFRDMLNKLKVKAEGESPIVPIIVGDAAKAIEVAEKLQKKGFDVRAVRPPTVPIGSSRLRIVIHANHKKKDLENLAHELSRCVTPASPPTLKKKSQPKNLTIIGTDTDVGKTIVSALLMRAAQRYGWKPSYWKPIQTGKESDTETVCYLAELNEDEYLKPLIELPKPASIDQAAEDANTSVDIASVIKRVRAIEQKTQFIIAETAGGLLVPWNKNETQGDFIKQLGYEIVLVVRTGLGTLNHTLLTLEALTKRKIKVQAIFMVGEPHQENKKSIEKLTKNIPIFEVPYFKTMSTESIDFWLDTDNIKNIFLR